MQVERGARWRGASRTNRHPLELRTENARVGPAEQGGLETESRDILRPKGNTSAVPLVNIKPCQAEMNHGRSHEWIGERDLELETAHPVIIGINGIQVPTLSKNTDADLC